MKFNKLTALFTLLFAFGIFMTACEDTTDPTDPVVTYPAAPTNLMATSISNTEIALKWTLSTSEADTNFLGYKVFVNGTDWTSTPLVKGTTMATVTDLDEATEYTFSVYGVFKNGNKSQTPATIKWAPAFRFTTNVNEATIKLYVTSSDLGSGLNIYDAEGHAPKGLKVASIEDWSLGLETKTTGVIKFGPAGSLDYSAAGKTLKTVYLVSAPVYVDNLSDVFDSEVLSAKTFVTSYVDLTQIAAAANGKNAVFYVKEIRDGAAHYAKVLVKNVSGSYLQDDSYIECEVSYQTGADLPYAK